MARYVKDSRGDEWEITVNVNTIRRVRDRTAGTVDLFEPAMPDDKPIWQTLYRDVLLWYDVLHAACLPQCQERGISEEQFGERFAGDQLVHARELFFEEWAAFLQGLQLHEKALVVEAAVKTMTKAAKRIREEIESQNVTARAIAKADKILSDSFGDLRERLGSILEDTPTGS